MESFSHGPTTGRSKSNFLSQILPCSCPGFWTRRIMLRYLFSIVICNILFGNNLFAQEKVESQNDLFEGTTFSISRIKALSELARDVGYNNPDSAYQIASFCLSLAQKAKQEDGLVIAHFRIADVYVLKGELALAKQHADTAVNLAISTNNHEEACNIYNLIGIIHSDQGEYDRSIEVYWKSYRLAEKINYKKGLGNSNFNIGVSYYYKAEYSKAIEFYLKGLKLMEELQDTISITTGYNNLAVFYHGNNQFDRALAMNLKCLKFLKENNLKGRADTYNNIANLYISMDSLEQGMYYHDKSLELRKQIGDKRGMASTYNNIANYFKKINDYDKAAINVKNAIKLAGESGFQYDEATYLRSLAIVYFYDGNFKDAELIALKALKLSLHTGARMEISENYYLLADIYRSVKKHQKATEYMFLHKLLSDSLYDEEFQKTFTEMESKYESDKKQKQIELLEKDRSLQELELTQRNIKVKQQAMQRNVLIAGLGLVLVLAFVTYRSYRQKKKDNSLLQIKNDEIVLQKDIIEEKNKDIFDSINYAKRIQKAILPPDSLVSQCLENSFILYKPKDIVAGDFYWLEKKDNLILFAAADCTGHGVPGALVSVLCSNALNRAVNEFGLTNPGKILDKVTNLLLETFEKSEEDVHDGMDIALCCLEPEKNILQFSGANNPLILIRDGELSDIKADKQPIGKFENRKPFSNHTVELKKGDSIYVFSDGFADQFGGVKGKKFKYARLKELLLNNASKTMIEQSKILEQVFEEWKGNLEQVDDVCIVGVRI